MFLFLEERTKRVDHEPTAEERLEAKRWSWKRWPEYDFVPSGVLRLRIADLDHTGIRTTWSDGKGQRIGHCLSDFIAGLFKAAAAIKRRRVERLEQEKRRREEAEQRMAPSPGSWWTTLSTPGGPHPVASPAANASTRTSRLRRR
ncbi:MAG: hypothetical protein GTN62_04845 [Gemmatimonadales bacterium]|nr:hypothetical protein [Gemmatimonadales bacterium]NIN10715.1 hypothetical protein [Gemmatimonadales bacterium]NIN49427.1 hypothetical protein [Gemmatimonadales bacterium]NIP06891.1 hypothetical protein [Gemmatimonadales bacterium]NIR01574.1 hypothetical protein [Gemmatimonadales bacterium]